MARDFICAMCGEELETDTPEADALAEMENYFGKVPEAERVQVCDDCFRFIDPADHPEKVAAAITETKGDA